jgi:phage baseplate assembly protein gpV
VVVEVGASAVTITAPTINLVGNVNMTGSVVNNGKNIGSTHTHGGVRGGGDVSGVPT